jgi:hypothetical protein
MVAGLDSLHRLADSFHHPGAFVPQHDRAGSAAITEINVGMANPAGHYAHQRFVIARTFHFQALDLQWAARRPQYGGSNGDDGRIGHFELSPLNSKERELLSARLAQTADAQTQQPQRARNQFVPAQQETTQPVNVSRLGHRFLD